MKNKLSKGAASPKAMKKTRRSSEEIMQRLLNAASEEFKRCGFVGATTAAIARKADITEAQLFRYFATKADLFREAVFEPLNRHFAEFNAKHPVTLKKNEDIRENARLYISQLQQFLSPHSELLLSLIVSQLFTSGSLQGIGEIESLHQYFERGAAMMSSRIEKNPTVEPELLVRVSFAALLGCVLFKDWVLPKRFASEDDFSEAITNFLIDGINVNVDSGLRSAIPGNVKRKVKSDATKSSARS